MNGYARQPAILPIVGIVAAVALAVSIFLPCESSHGYSATYMDFVNNGSYMSAVEWLLVACVAAGAALAVIGSLVRAVPSNIAPGAAWLALAGFSAGLAGEIIWIVDFSNHYAQANSSGISIGFGVWIGVVSGVAGAVAAFTDARNASVAGPVLGRFQPQVRPGPAVAMSRQPVAAPAAASWSGPAGGGTAHLAYVEGGHPESLTVVPGQRIVIGRGSTASIRLSDPRVSRNHLLVERRGSSWVVSDMGATNPTRLLGPGGSSREIHGETPIDSGQLLVGDVLVTLFPN